MFGIAIPFYLETVASAWATVGAIIVFVLGALICGAITSMRSRRSNAQFIISAVIGSFPTACTGELTFGGAVVVTWMSCGDPGKHGYDSKWCEILSWTAVLVPALITVIVAMIVAVRSSRPPNTPPPEFAFL